MTAMLYVLLSAALCLAGAVGTARAAVREAGFLRARRSGVHVQAEVVDNDTAPTMNAGQYYVTPVVRYHIDGRRYEAALVNASGLPGTRGWVATFLAGAALLVWALALL